MTAATEREELLPCPFCGKEPLVHHFEGMKATLISCPDWDCPAGEINAEPHDWNRRAPSWRPIETAPRDGTPILLHLGISHLCGYSSTERPRKTIAIGYFDGYWVVSIVGQAKDGKRGASSIGGGDDQFTHWQPLPSAPR